MVAWTDFAVSILRKGWADGLSASQIGKKLGRSRNAVIGKVHRLGLTGRVRATRTILPYRRVVRIRPRAAVCVVPKHVVRATKASYLRAELVLIATLPALGPALSEAEAGCRYIVGDPQTDTRICGRAAIDGPWCCQHRRLVYQPASPKARIRTAEDDERRRWRREMLSAEAAL